MRDIDELKKEFENFDIKDSGCMDGSCDSDEGAMDDLKDYPSYTDALYAKLTTPHISGIYISRWDIKDIALDAGESMAIHPRKRMFELLMKYATTKDNMQKVLDSLEKHMRDKMDTYQEFIDNFPASADIFQDKINKAEKTIALFPLIIKEYFED